jgi:hypothetical protein
MKIKICVCIIVCALLLTGCSLNREVLNNDITETVPLSISINDFKGPYAEELYAQVFNSENKPFLYQIYKDGVVTDEELAESRQMYSECLTDLGYKVEFDAKGYETVTSPDTRANLDAAADEARSKELENNRAICSNKSGYLQMTAMYAELKSNPNKEDFYKIMAECLVRHGLAPKGYTKDDFLNEDSEDKSSVLYKALEHEEEYTKCQNNPLDL